MSTMAQRVATSIQKIAALHRASEFTVGDTVLYGKWKNQRGKVIRFFDDERGVPSVEVEPVPKGRKQNKTLGLYKIWKTKEERQKQACVIFSTKCDGNVMLGKVRDRMYDPEICVYHLEVDGTEVCIMFDRTTGFCEGINEHGLGIVNSSLMVLQDEREGVADGDDEPERSPDGIKIVKALSKRTIPEALRTLIMYTPKKFQQGLKGHTLVSDGTEVYALENTRIHTPKALKLAPDKVHTRTNHGIYYPGAGYTKGDDYISSIVRQWEAKKQLEKVQRAEDLMPALTQGIEKADGAMSPTRFTDKMRTTSQMVANPGKGEMLLYLVPEHSKFEGVRNLLPGGRKPKLKVRVFKYPSKEQLKDPYVTVPDEMDSASAKKSLRRQVMAERIAARYKSKKKVKKQDGGDMTVYEYSDRQVADRNRKKAERIEKLRGSMAKLQTKVRKDVQSKDEKVRDVALAVGLMDETFERVGNPGSAKEGHFGVTTWRVKHIKFGKGGATITYVGKSGVDQKKKITNPRIVGALKKVCKDKGPDDCALSISASDVNAYLKSFGISAKDIRGFHANTEMKVQLKKVRKGKLPADPKEKEKKLKDEFNAALEATAERVGHEASTLKSQYLVPGVEDDYMKDGTVNESHTKKGAEVGTDTATILAIAPEQLRRLQDNKEFYALTRMFGEGGDGSAGDGGYDDWRSMVQEHGGAVFETGADGSFDVKLEDTGALPIKEFGLKPPYGTPEFGKNASSLRTAAENGTPTERRILANAVNAPVLVVRDRTWWLREAPNLYRLAREHEKVRPAVAGLQFDPQVFSVLWYEDEDGNNLGEPKYSNDEAPVEPEGARYQLSQFPNYLRDSMLRLNDDGTSTAVMEGNRGFPEDLVTAMVRTAEWDVGDAIMVAAQSCERCLNVLCQCYLGADEGYKFASEPYWKCGTRCKLCDHIDNAPEESFKLATKSKAEKDDENVQKMLRKEPKLKPPRYDLRNNRTLEEDDEDLEGMGGGDNGDRDLSMKWNKVGHRVAFRWLATPVTPSPVRVHLYRVAETQTPPPPAGGGAQQKEAPTFDEWVKEKRWPSKADNAPPGAEIGFEGLKKQDPSGAEKVRAEFKALFPGAGDEDGKKEKGKKDEPKERTREDIDADLESARNDVEELEDTVAGLQDEIKESKRNIVKLRQKAKKPRVDPGARKEKIKSQITEEKTKMRQAVVQMKPLGKEMDAHGEKMDGLQEQIKESKRNIVKLRQKAKKPQIDPNARREKIEERIGEEKAKMRDAVTKMKAVGKEMNALEEAADEDGSKEAIKDLKKEIKDLKFQINYQRMTPRHPQWEPTHKKIEEKQEQVRETKAQAKDDQREFKEKEKEYEALRAEGRKTAKGVKFLEGKLEETQPEADDPEEALREERKARAEIREATSQFDDEKAALKEKTDQYNALRAAGRDGVKTVKLLEGKLEEADQEPDADDPEEQLKAERKKLQEAKGELKEKTGDLKAEEVRVKELEAERTDPSGAKRKQEQAKKKEQQKRVRDAVSRTTATMASMMGKGSGLSPATKAQIESQLEDMSDEDLEQFALEFENSLKGLTSGDPTSDEAVLVANAMSKSGYTTQGITDPTDLAERVAKIAYTRNVMANPMITGGVPVGQTEMDPQAYGQRALAGYEQFKRLNGILRREAAGRIDQELRGLDPETDRAQELKAILTGMNTAQVVDTGEALRGQPQPNKGNVALIRKMSETGNIDQMFKPVEDYFSSEGRQAMRNSLNNMEDDELSEFIIGDDPKHPFAKLKDILQQGGTAGSEYKQLIKSFLVDDWMNDNWAARATRDVMEGAGAADWDDSGVWAEINDEAKANGGPRREEAYAAMARIDEARAKGVRPNEDDQKLIDDVLGKGGEGHREIAKSLVDTLKEKFNKWVISPATAVYKNFVDTGDKSVMDAETVPHPDEGSPEPRTEEQREKAREKTETSEEEDSPKYSPEEIKRRRTKLKMLRTKLKAQRAKVNPAQRKKLDAQLERIEGNLSDKPEDSSDDGEQPEDKEHGPGDVWETEQGNWRAKNPDGAPKSFKEKDPAEVYAKGPQDGAGEDDSGKGAQGRVGKIDPKKVYDAVERPEGWRSWEDAPVLTGENLDSWHDQHRVSTPKGSTVFGTKHFQENIPDDVEGRLIQEKVIPEALEAAGKAIAEGKPVVYLAEGWKHGDQDPEYWSEHDYVAKALKDKFGDKVKLDTWDDDQVDLNSDESPFWQKMFDAAGGDEDLAKFAIAVDMLAQGDDPEDLRSGEILTPEVEKMVRERFGKNSVEEAAGLYENNKDAEDRGPMWRQAFPEDFDEGQTEISALSHIYHQAREDRLVDKIKETEDAGGVAIGSAGSDHAWSMKTPLENLGRGGPSKSASNKVADLWLARVRSIHPDDPNRPMIVIQAA